VQNVAVNHTFAVRPTLLLHSTFGFNRQRGGSLSSGPFSFPDAGVRIASAASSALKAPPELVMSVTGGFTSTRIISEISIAATSPFART
jgi:hypothetical protein